MFIEIERIIIELKTKCITTISRKFGTFELFKQGTTHK